MRTKALFSLTNTAGAVAFNCSVDPHRAAYPDAVVLMRLGDVPPTICRDARRRLRKTANHRASGGEGRHSVESSRSGSAAEASGGLPRRHLE